MRRNSGWKRAGCVLLAAQMTLGLLPVNTLAANSDPGADLPALETATPSTTATPVAETEPALSPEVSAVPSQTPAADDIGPTDRLEPPGEAGVPEDGLSQMEAVQFSDQAGLYAITRYYIYAFAYNMWASPIVEAVVPPTQVRVNYYNYEGTNPLASIDVDFGFKKFTSMNGANIPALPNLESEGVRIPDKKFDGWHLYTGATVPDAALTDEGLAFLMDEAAAEAGDPYALTSSNIASYVRGAQGNYRCVFAIANWKDSDNADLVALDFSGFNSRPEDGRETDLTFQDQAGGGGNALTVAEGTPLGDGGSYYAQVPAYIDRLTLDFSTYEPGTMIDLKVNGAPWAEYDYTGTQHTSNVWNGPSAIGRGDFESWEAANSDPDSTLIRTLPGRRTELFPEQGAGAPKNSADAPARGVWALPKEAAIELDYTTAQKQYNEIVLTVTAPDGVTTSVNTFFVERLRDPEMTLAVGNTPYGMIARDEGLRDSEKEALAAVFSSTRSFPVGALPGVGNNDGAAYTGKYSAEAWGGGTDYDLDPTALVVYQNASFTDPGFALVDTRGNAVLSTDVEHSLALRQVSALTGGVISDTAGTTAYYIGGGLTTDVDNAWQTVATGEGKDVFDLRQLAVAPGIYSLEYRFTDPADGGVYGSGNVNDYEDAALAADFSRPVIVLPQPGDVDMDGAVTLADALTLEALLDDPTSWLNAPQDAAQRLMKYRVCDVDGDGMVTATDVDTLKAGFTPQVISGRQCDLYYQNSGDAQAPAQKRLSSSEAGAGSPALSVEYMGANLSAGDLTHTNDDPVQIGDTVWIGLKLTNAQQVSAQAVEALTLTLTYDARYLTPAVITGAVGDSAQEKWLDSIKTINLTTTSVTPWKDGYELGSATAQAGALVPTAGLALAEKLSGDGLQTLTFSIRRKAAEAGTALVDGYLLCVPFTLSVHPVGVENDIVALVEPALGPRQFCAVYQDGSKMIWDQQGSSVFGGVTGNLATNVIYTGSQPVPMGEDKTEKFLVVDNDGANAQYGEAFISTHHSVYSGDLVGALPDGFLYDSVLHTISTTCALKAGTYRFYISGKLCQLTVEKAPLTLSVDPGEKYYGEADPYSMFTFQYDATQIKALDVARGATNDGKGASLEALLNDTDYTAPTIQAEDSNGRPVGANTDAGSYLLRLSGASATNYAFSYRNATGEEDDGSATNSYSIRPRPIRIDGIQGPVATIASRASILEVTGLTAQNGAGKGQFTAAYPSNRNETTGVVNGMLSLHKPPILDGDTVQIAYRASFSWDPAKGDSNGEFELGGEASQERPVTLSGVTLGAGTGNYALAANPFVNDKSTGIVVRDPAIELRFTTDSNPVTTSYTYGQVLALGGDSQILLEVTYQGGTKATVSYSLGNTAGINLRWTEKDGDPLTTGLPASDGQQLTVTDHDGKYLCFYISNGTGVDPAYAAAYVGPFQVSKAPLDLAVAAEERYYGEPDPASTIAYDESQLASWDYASFYHDGTVADLVGLPGYQPPTVSRRETAALDGKEVAQGTHVGAYYVLLQDALADNYTFTYTQAGQDGAVEAGKSFGYAPMTVVRRPILVTEITGTVGFLYDDTRTLDLTGIQGQIPAATEQGFNVKTAIPTGSVYLGGGGSSQPLAHPLTGTAVYDDDSLSITYQARFTSDRPSHPFYQAENWGVGEKAYQVTISQLALADTGDSSNYELVYRSNDKAYSRAPQTERGSGNVVLRQIEELEIRSVPEQMSYTYGEHLRLNGLTVRIYYNSDTGNRIYKDVNYEQYKVGGVVTGDSFQDNGLTLLWENGDPAAEDQLLQVGIHHGQKLQIKGQRFNTHVVKTTATDVAVQVKKKPITVTVTDITRVYGESNLLGQPRQFTASVDWAGELIEEDYNKLVAANLTAETFTTTSLAAPISSAALAAIDAAPIGPMFRTNAVPTSPVGDYALWLEGGSLSNYDFSFENGVIHVIKRKIILVGINKDPIYTMIEGGDRFVRGLTATATGGASNPEAAFIGGPSGYSQTGNAILDGDQIRITMDGEFGYDINGTFNMLNLVIPSGQYLRDTYVKITNVALSGASAKNYELANSLLNGSNGVTRGRIDKRKIVKIELDKNEPTLSYTYGERLDLSGLTLKVTQEAAGSGQAQLVTPNVPLDSGLQGLSVHYVGSPALLEDPANWGKIAAGDYGPAAANGDLLSIAPGDPPDGSTGSFSAQGKYLVITVLSPDGTCNAEPLVIGPLELEAKELTFSLQVDGKVYDGTTKAWGAVRLDQNQLEPGDVVYLVNDVAYNNIDMTQVENTGGEYVFYSAADYNDPLSMRFAFADPNVAYQSPTGHDDYGALAPVKAEVKNLQLTGRSAANYRIVSSVADTAPEAPEAVISKASRSAPTVVATLSTNINTNTLQVKTDRNATTQGNSSDKYNSELHYEYQLEYLSDESLPASGTQRTAVQDSVYFGGEKVDYVGEDFTPAPGEKDELTPGLGQPVEGDGDFGSRVALPRDTYFRVNVRLAETHNYLASNFTPSVPDGELATLVAEARAAEEPDTLPASATSQSEVQPPVPIPDDRPLGKSYQYRLDLIAAQTMQGDDGESHVRSQLDAVWFTDRATFFNDDHLNALTTDPVSARYHVYAWDDTFRQAVRFPLDLSERILVDLPQPDGSTVETEVNANATAQMFVSLVPRGGGSSYRITILPTSVTAHLGDAPYQLKLEIEPHTNLGVGWKSSDTKVVTVDRNGLLTFVGEGTAKVSVWFGDSIWDDIVVKVLPQEIPLPDSLLNLDYTGVFMYLDENGAFYPGREMTRGELAMSLARFFQPAQGFEQGEPEPFTDITEDMPWAEAVDLLSSYGVLNGVGEGRFAPEAPASRAEMVTILARMMGLILPTDPAAPHAFVDAGPEETWAWAAIDAMAQVGIAKGVGEGRFRPDAKLTRAAAAAFLSRLMTYQLDLAREDLLTPADVTEGHWAWGEILQAINGAKTEGETGEEA